MAGTVTITDSNDTNNARPPVRRIVIAWTSDASGDANGTHTARLSGELLRVVFIPDAVAVPTALYDVTLEDDNVMDVLAGQGANLSETTTTNVCPGVPLLDGTTTSVRPMVIDDALELKVSNAGNAKQGQVIIYLK